jgi:alpha-mannosidase
MKMEEDMAEVSPAASHEKMLMMRVERMRAQHIAHALYRSTSPVSTIDAWKVGGEPVSFAQAQEAWRNGRFHPMKVGDSWGAAWDTWWIRVTGTVPSSWAAQKECTPELVVDLGSSHLGPGFSCEGTVYRPDGTVIKAVEPFNDSVPLPQPGQQFEMWIEAAANPEIPNGFPYYPTDLGDEGVKSGPELYRLARLEMGLLDHPVWTLNRQTGVLLGLARELPADRARRAQILTALQNAMDELDTNNISGTAAAASARLKSVLSKPSDGTFTVWASGYAHIDTPWLWPERETPRKVARTFSNQLWLMDHDPSYTFVATSAQHYAWLKEQHPDLYQRVQEKVHAGQMIPIGGMWVESDANLPSGESMARQFLLGTTWFDREFGFCSPVAFLPDSFGYSGNLPQIMRLAGNKYFVTQKISWNDTDRFPHTTFLWKGIDGTPIYTHFPPSNKYNSDLSPADVAASEKNDTEKGASSSSLLLFGWGDGGGGATREMLEDAHLQANLLGSPTVKLGSPADFFAANEKEMRASSPFGLPTWTGELYLEQHRGTTSSEANTKHGNRECESLLRAAEWWASQAYIQTGLAYPYNELRSIWEQVCLYQFHDTLPGSSIAWVYAEVEREQKKLEARIREIIHRSLQALAGVGSTPLIANAGPIAQLGVSAGAVKVSSQSSSSQTPTGLSTSQETASDGSTHYIFDSPVARYVVTSEGWITSALDHRTGRDAIDPNDPANVLQLFRDSPSEFDAWNIDENYYRMPQPGSTGDTAHWNPSAQNGMGELKVTGQIGHSQFTKTISLDPDTGALTIAVHVDWNESDRLLKLAFPLALQTNEETAEIQYGHITRPITSNTSWDEARYEYAMQRWCRVCENGGFGVGIANHVIYGHDVKPFNRANGLPGTCVRLTLLRASHFPVPHADVGPHDFTVLFEPGASLAETIRLGYRASVPAQHITGQHAVSPLFDITTTSGVLPEAVKMAEDRSGDVIVRLYESLGRQEKARLTPHFAWAKVQEVGLIEKPNDDVQPAIDGGAVHADPSAPLDLTVHPFQIVTLRFTPQH